MAAYLQNLSGDALQRHTIVFEQTEVIFTLKYWPSIERWCFDVEYKNKQVLNIVMVVGALHIESKNLPFDFFVEDTTGLGLDPYRLTDFEEDRCKIIMLDAQDMQELRGAPVEI